MELRNEDGRTLSISFHTGPAVQGLGRPSKIEYLEMKIAFDHQIFTLQSYGGISRYFVQLAKGLLTEGDDIKVIAPYHQNNYLEELPGKLVRGRKLEHFPPKTSRLIHFVNQVVCNRKIREIQPDILHETYYSATQSVGNVKRRILTVYDMIHEKFPNEFPLKDRTAADKRKAVERADHIICISHSTKRDLCELLGILESKISVVHLGFERFSKAHRSSQIGKSGRPYLLYVGNRGGYKNFKGTVRAISSKHYLSSNLDIIAFGGGPFTAEETDLINSLGFAQNSVRHVEGDDQILGSLYLDAAAFIYPSLYEGFGLPPLEAMAHDCPVISSDTSSMPEVIGSAAELFDPRSIDDQAEAICRVISNSSRRDELITAGRDRLRHFSWDKCTQETREIYLSLI